jgi:hypothetical protein
MSRLQDRRYLLAGGVAVAVLIAAIGWLGVISPQLSKASALRGEAANVEQQNSVLGGKVKKLKDQNANIDSLTTALQNALDALPYDSGLPAFTRQLSRQAQQHQIVVTSIAVASITAAAIADPGPTTATSPGTSAGGTPAVAPGRLLAIPITLVSTGSLPHQLAFLTAIQSAGPRRALVTSTQLTPSSGSVIASLDASCTMTTQLTVFTAALSPQAQAQLEKLLSGDVSE